MSTLRLELGESVDAAPCECCGARSQTAHGFVYRDEDAYAVYYAGWSDGHPARGVTLAIAVGEWANGSTPADRTSIGMIATSSPSSIDFRVVSPAESPWGSTPLLGDMLEREQALAHPALKEVMHVAEHIVRDDTRVRRFLDSSEMNEPITSETAAYVCNHVFEHTHPVLFIARDDGDWQFLCGGAHGPEELPRVVGLNHLFEDDPSLHQVADLPASWEAQRNFVGGPWVRRLIE